MTVLSADQIYAYARQAGFTGASAVLATAIALAESGGRTDAVGDRNLTTIGEQSTGLWQVNYRPQRDANNPTRDPRTNLDPGANAAAAYQISGGGQSFKPWSTYTNGAYRSYLPTALAAAGRAGDNPTLPQGITSDTTSSSSPASSSSSSSTNPFNLGGGLLNGALGGVAKLVIPTVAVIGALALVGAGVYRSVTARTGKPSIPPAAAALAL